MRNHSALAVAMVLSVCMAVFAQTKPQAEAPKGAIVDAPHDFSGVWMLDHTRPLTVVERFWMYELTEEEPPMTSWGQEQYDASKSSFGTRSYPLVETNDPIYHVCSPPGYPRVILHPFPLQIVQSPSEVIMLFEYDSVRHQIFTDGRAHDTALGPSWMGDAIGHWEGDTLVADTVNFNTKTWLDRVGHPHSESLHLVERIRRPNHFHLTDDITVEDPTAYTKPWTAHLDFLLRLKWTLAELFCEDQDTFDDIENNETKAPAK